MTAQLNDQCFISASLILQKTTPNRYLGFLMKSSLILVVAFLLVSIQAWGQPASARALEDYLSSFSREEIRTLTKNQDLKESFAAGQVLSKKLEAKELGKKSSVVFVSSGDTSLYQRQGEPDRTVVSSDIRVIRVQGTPVYASVNVRVPKTIEDKIKECKKGRKIAAFGTIGYISLTGGHSIISPGKYRIRGANMIAFSLVIEADDVGVAR